MSAYTIRQLRAAAPAEFRELDDDELVREYARVKQIPFEQAADYYKIKPSGTAAETVRQIGAGFAVDLPRMVGQGLKYTGLAPELGQDLVTSADERAYGWQPDLRGRGLVGEALVTGGRAIGPMAPAIAAAFVPGGQVVAPTVAAGLFGTSSAQETYEKLRGQGISEEDAQAAAARVGLIQGPLEGVATYTGLKAFSAARPLLGLGATTSQVAGSMTTGNALKSFGKAFGTNLLVQPGTEVIQDTATEGVERAYGAAPEDLGEIARSSALAGVGLTLLLGPLSIGGHIGRARRAEELKTALYDPNTPTEVRAQAMDMVMAEATRQNVAPQDIDSWFESQLELEDARNAELARMAEMRGERERNLLIDETIQPLAPLQQRIDLAQGLTRTPQRDYESQFTAADQEPSGQFVQDPETGIERELTMGEYYAQLQGLEPSAAPTAAGAPTATPAAPAAAVDPRRQILRDTYGIVPTKPALQLVDAIEAEGLALDSPVVADVINFAAQKPMSAKRLEQAIERLDKAIIESRKAPSVSTTTPVRPTAPVAPAQAAAPVVPVDGQAPAVNAPTVAPAPVAPVTQAVTPAPAPAPATAPAGEQTAPDILTLVFGEQDADIVRAYLAGQSAQKITDDLKAQGVTGRARSTIANKVVGEKAVREQWPRKIAEAKRKYNLTDADIQDALRAAVTGDADTRSEVEREMNLGMQRGTIAAPMSETEAVEAGLEGSVASVGGSTSAVKGFTKLQKKVDAVLKQIEKATDPQVLAALRARLDELAIEVRAVERSEQARVRTEAGKETEIAVDTEAELEAPVERAAPKKAEAAPEKAEGETKAKGKKKSKEEKEAEAEELSAEGKAARAAADAKLAAESAAKRSADRKGLVVGDTVMNPKLGTGVVKSFAGDGDATTVTVDFQSGQTKELSVKLAKLEKTDAVQKPSAAKVPVRDRAEAGQRDGAKDAKGAQAATEGQTTQEKYAQVVSGVPGAPAFADLTNAQQDQIADLARRNQLNLAAVNTVLTPAAGADVVTERGDAPTEGQVEEAAAYTADELTADLKDFMRVDTLGKSVIIVDKPTDLEDLRDIAIGLTNVRSFGWTRDGKAVLIASRIRKGTGRAKFMHEVGSHLGMQRLLPPEMFNRLVDQVLTWAARTDNSLETRLAKAAIGRVPENTNPASVRNEIAAYFVEEATLAGVNPTAARQLNSPVAKWMRSLFDAMKRALTKLGVKVETLTARDVVNLAYGAASLRLETDGVAPRGTELELGVQVGPDTAAFKRWFKDSKAVDAEGKPLVVYHGTNKSFVTFDIRRSGSASGQYFGQGFYFARSPGVADAFKGEGGDGPRIMSVYLAVSQPFYTNTTDLSDAQLTALRNNEQLGDALKKAEAEAAGAPFSSWYTLQRAAVLSGKRSTYIRDALESLGFDGIITDSLTEGSTAQSDAEIIVFRPEQIKSATNNRGTYDPADSNIEFGMEPLKAPTTSTVEKNINALLPPVARKPVRGTLASISRQSSKALDYVVFTSDLINRAVDVGVKSAKQFGDLLAARATKAREMERDVERIADLYTLVPESDRGTGPNSVNQFIFDSTREGKWGYDTATRKADPEMEVRFNNLKPESQNLVRAMFEYGDKMLALKKKTVLDTTASEYDALIAASKAAGDTVTEARQIKEKADTLKRFKSLFAIREGIPYAPIKRTGDHVVVAKSAEYVAAEEAGDTAKLEKLQANGDHYHVSFTDTAAQARTLREQLEDQGAFGGGSVDNFERETKSDVLYAGESTLKALTALRNKAEAEASEGDKSSAKLLSIISQLYLEALADGSARKSEMKRRGVAGEVDMLSSFALQGRADANFLASLEFNPQVQDTLQKMRRERDLGGNRDRKSQLFNELAKRYEGSLETPNNPWLDKLTRASSIYYLATSPAYYLQNLTQPFMMSLPAMAGRHDYGKSSAELVKAYGQLGDVIKSVKLGNQLQQQWDFSKVPADVRDAIMTLADRGRIDIGLDTELGEFRVEGEGAFAARWNKIDKALRTMVQKGEAINRLSTAMAAYRLELAKTKSPEAALDYADRILQETHGDYSRFNAPRAFNTPVGKVALQFRKFQLIQLTFYAKLINDALTGRDRAVALKTLGYALGHTAVLAGTMGLPGYAAISWALGSILGSDDEEFDLTDELRKYIGDEELATMILRGAPTVAGMDISGKVGAGTMLSIMPFSNADLTTRSGVYEAAGTVLTGASGGMLVRGLDGAQLMLSGDFYKGLELLMPKGVSDAMKSYRIADEGMTRRNGDVILPPDEVNSLDAVFQALGIAPVKQTVVYEKRQRFQDMTANFTDRTTRIKNNYVAAMRKGDTATAAEAREAWKNLQDAKVRNGLKRSPLSDLLKAPREQQKRERNTRDGIQFNRSTQRAAEEIAER